MNISRFFIARPVATLLLTLSLLLLGILGQPAAGGSVATSGVSNGDGIRLLVRGQPGNHGGHGGHPA